MEAVKEEPKTVEQKETVQEEPKTEEHKETVKEEKKEEGELILNPNEFSNKTGKELDYIKIIEQFGCRKIDDELLERFAKLTDNKVHTFLRRDIFFAHRDMHTILNLHEQKKPIYLYTGRGPSTDAMHLGHLLPFIFNKWLQDVLDCPIVIQITDDEKYFYQQPKSEKFKPNDLNWFSKIALENIKDIIACGFNPEKTFIFMDTEYIQHLYPNICRLQRHITYSQVKGIFGLTGSENTGKTAFPAIQAAPCMASCFPHIFGDKNKARCLIPCGIDQDPYFRMTRDIAGRLKFPKPAGIYSKFFPALQGFDKKMSSSDPNSAIFLNDTPNQIKKKINKFAFSGGQETLEEHREKGANLNVDVPYHYLKFFLDDDEEFKRIGEEYSSGRMLTSEIKSTLITLLQKIVKDHQDARSKVTTEVIKQFMKIRPIK